MSTSRLLTAHRTSGRLISLCTCIILSSFRFSSSSSSPGLILLRTSAASCLRRKLSCRMSLIASSYAGKTPVGRAGRHLGVLPAFWGDVVASRVAAGFRRTRVRLAVEDEDDLVSCVAAVGFIVSFVGATGGGGVTDADSVAWSVALQRVSVDAGRRSRRRTSIVVVKGQVFSCLPFSGRDRHSHFF